ncbi:alpha/beta fold hydrolase [Gloeobacter kilaueensis]|uniref:Hydrolase n=1 Tax=Gloeobacter kilaueensis (strain ATCC BAA-2537 / CCAP 1431/1 / ULC 316 / JS1) TaxID=1183438 RepID=U5QP90_GLOK1|nr:alpha/beta fold hydrolase [Gloeobacter kilaueensis]AGY59475.1 hydrolase [Gloeobacter kilaueensis JS1]
MSERPLLLYLPGLDGTGKLFYRQEIHLAPYCDVVALSIPIDDLGDWQSLVVRVRELLPADRRPVLLCGESFGGCLALMSALAYPEAFDALVLVNPATAWRRQNWLVQGSHWLSLLPTVSLQVAALVFLPFLSAVNRLTPADRRTLLATVRLVPRETILHRLQLLEQCNLDADLERLTLPVLLLGGRMDRLLPSLSETHFLEERLPNAQREVLPHSGHAALLDSDLNLADYLLRHGLLPQPAEAG